MVVIAHTEFQLGGELEKGEIEVTLLQPPRGTALLRYPE